MDRRLRRSNMRRRAAQVASLGPAGPKIAQDVVVVTETDVRELSDNPSLILYSASQEGRELYAAE